MKINNYILSYLGDVPYILPYGQSNANHQKSIMLNESSVAMWNNLATAKSLEELTDTLYKHFGQEVPRDQLKKDIQDFVYMLKTFNIVDDCDDYIEGTHEYFYNKLHIADNSIERRINIAGISMKIFGPAELIHPSFDSFLISSTEDSEPQTVYNMNITLSHHLPDHKLVGETIVRTDELSIMQLPDRFICVYHGQTGLCEWQLFTSKENYGKCNIFYNHKNDTILDDIFHAIRMAFLLYAQTQGMMAIHSASILYNNQVWLFSGPSGTGKSTHTRLWKKLFDIELLNGDVNLVEVKGNKAYVHGIPWCGTSEIFSTDTYELGGIVFLKQEVYDAASSLDLSTGIHNILQRIISPTWTKTHMEYHLDFTEKLVKCIDIFKLECTMNDSAAKVMKYAIDTKDNSNE